MITQKQAIKDYLEKFGSITSKEAWSKFGITRLAPIILRLRKTLKIDSIEERDKRFNWVRYKLVK